MTFLNFLKQLGCFLSSKPGFDPAKPVEKPVEVEATMRSSSPQPQQAETAIEKSFSPNLNGATKHVRSVPKEPLATNISISALELGVFSPRMQFDPTYITELAEDIKAEGQLKPIMVRPHPTEPNRYQAVDGEHRVRALRKLGETLVRAEIHALTDEEAYYRAMRINQLHGKALEELEEACHINKMKGIFDYSEEQIAKRFSRSQSWVRDRLILALSLAPMVEENVSNRLLTSTDAIRIAVLPKEEQTQVAELIAKKRKNGFKISTRATTGLVHAIKEAKTPEEKQRILDKPVEVYAELYRKKPKALERAMAPEAEVLLQRFDCPCGCGYYLLVQWNERKGEWRKK